MPTPMGDYHLDYTSTAKALSDKKNRWERFRSLLSAVGTSITSVGLYVLAFLVVLLVLTGCFFLGLGFVKHEHYFPNWFFSFVTVFSMISLVLSYGIAFVSTADGSDDSVRFKFAVFASILCFVLGGFAA